jgi:hypothetical protein
VEQASGLWFRASRPKPAAGGHWLHDCTPTCNQSPPTKFGVTPNLTGVTPVPPTALDLGPSMLVIFHSIQYFTPWTK